MKDQGAMQPAWKERSSPSLRPRMAILAIASVSMVAALWAALARIGWAVTPWPPATIPQHGPLMISGFLGTLISLERGVAMSQFKGRGARYYAPPLLAGLGALLVLAGAPPVLGRGLSVLGALGLVLVFVVIYRWQPSTDHAIMGLGAVSWLVGNILWLVERPIYQIAPWWAGFLILTIAGERLELARVLLLSQMARRSFVIVVSLFLTGLIISLVTFDAGMRLAGLAALGLGLWLLRFDIARRTIRKEGLTRFIAACLLPGYLWLMVGGLLWLIFGGSTSAGLNYDAMYHSLFLGFTLSMIFGHAPIILPALMGIPTPYSRLFYGHLALLHLSLVLRIAGDLFVWHGVRRWGGMLNEISVLLFLVVTAITIRKLMAAESYQTT